MCVSFAYLRMSFSKTLFSIVEERWRGWITGTANLFNSTRACICKLIYPFHASRLNFPFSRKCVIIRLKSGGVDQVTERMG